MVPKKASMNLPSNLKLAESLRTSVTYAVISSLKSFLRGVRIPTLAENLTIL